MAMQLFNNPRVHRGATIISLPMHAIYRIVRDRIEYMCMGERSIDPDAVCQNVCVELEKAAGIFPNIPGFKSDEPQREKKPMQFDLEQRVIQLRKATELAASPGNADVDHYMRGMANGLILALAIMEEKTPEYLVPETVKSSEETSPEIGAIAARLTKITHRQIEDALDRSGGAEQLIKDIRALAGSALTQRPDKPKRGPRD